MISRLRSFITRIPFREIATRRMLRFWPVNRRKRQSPVLCLHTPFPQKYKVSFGVPIMGGASQWQSTSYGINKSLLVKKNSKIYVRSSCYSVQRTLCHSEKRSDVRISRKGLLIKRWYDVFVAGKSDAPSARCVTLARCGIIFVIAKHKHGTPRDTMWKSK